MKSIYKDKVRKWGTFILAGALSVTPLMAESATTINIAAHEEGKDYPSPWAVDTVMEGQNYGIYPLTWHDDFKAQISKAQIKELQEGIVSKISEIKGVRAKTRSAQAVIKDRTKGEVLKQLFWALKQFAYPKDLGLEGTDAISFMKKHGIVDERSNNVALNKPCTVEEAIVFGTRLIDWLYEELDAGTKGYFWKVEGGKNTVYLLGSVHVADTRLYPFSKKVLDAYDEADVVGFEIDESNDEDYEKFIESVVYNDGTSLKDHVSKAVYELLLEYSDLLDLTEAEMNGLKVWYLSNYISSLNFGDTWNLDESQEPTDYGVDNYFFTKAYFDNKEIYGLESYELQAKVFDSFSDELQETLLVQNLASFLYTPDFTDWNEEDFWALEKANNEWLTLMKNGDIEGFKQYYSNDDGIRDRELSEEYTQKLITNRDKQMAEKIEGYLKSDKENTYFIIVGAAHYISQTNNGVIDQLKQKGYTVTQIK